MRYRNIMMNHHSHDISPEIQGDRESGALVSKIFKSDIKAYSWRERRFQLNYNRTLYTAYS
jgi:hypothetical protein